MTTYVYRNGELVEKDVAEPLFESRNSFQYISDTMSDTWHPCDGNHYSSKKKFRETTRAHGGIEVGDQKDYGKTRQFVPRLDKRQRVEDIQRTIYELRNGRR